MPWITSYQKVDVKKVASLEAREGDSIALPRFSHDLAFEIGKLARVLANSYHKSSSFVVDITLVSGQVLYHTVGGKCVTMEDEEWVRKNREVVFTFGRSSLVMKSYQKKTLRCDKERESPFRFRGGSVPIALKKDGLVVGALTISGLPESDNHWVAIETLRRYAQHLKDTKSTS